MNGAFRVLLICFASVFAFHPIFSARGRIPRAIRIANPAAIAGLHLQCVAVLDSEANAPRRFQTALNAMTIGPRGRTHTEESKARISAANKGKQPWNKGVPHSPETRAVIAQRTKDAAYRKKVEQAASIGLNITEYENALKMESERARRSKLKGGLTEQGRRNISESMKQRWLQPGFREEYVQSRKTFVHHSKETKERISKVIKQKWADEDYRKRCSERIVPDEVRRKISETLKARWTDPDYRNRMLKGGCYQRSEQQKARIAESIRQKWRDPAYRNAVQSSVRNFYDRDNTDADSEGGGAARTKRDTSSSSYTSSSSSQATKRQRQATRVRERKFEKEDEEERKAQADKIAKINLRLDQRASRSAVLIAAKQAAAAAVQKGTTVNLKEILGDDLWFEEKMLHKLRGQSVPDDSALNALLLGEWGAPTVAAAAAAAAIMPTPTALVSASVFANTSAVAAPSATLVEGPSSSPVLETSDGGGADKASVNDNNRENGFGTLAAPDQVAIRTSEIHQQVRHDQVANSETEKGKSTGIATNQGEPVETATAAPSSLSPIASAPRPGGRRSAAVATAGSGGSSFREDVPGNHGRTSNPSSLSSAARSNIQAGASSPEGADLVDEDYDDDDDDEDKIEMYDARGRLVGVYTLQEYHRLQNAGTSGR